MGKDDKKKFHNAKGEERRRDSNTPSQPSAQEERVMAQFQQEKPRKLEEETITYLLEIEKQLKAIQGEGEQEEREVLVVNVLSEIQARTASAACDRQVNHILEELCQLASPSLLLQILQKWKSYSLFLARNRYASHVVQVRLPLIARPFSLLISFLASRLSFLAFAMPSNIIPSLLKMVKSLKKLS